MLWCIEVMVTPSRRAAANHSAMAVPTAMAPTQTMMPTDFRLKVVDRLGLADQYRHCRDTCRSDRPGRQGEGRLRSSEMPASLTVVSRV